LTIEVVAQRRQGKAVMLYRGKRRVRKASTGRGWPVRTRHGLTAKEFEVRRAGSKLECFFLHEGQLILATLSPIEGGSKDFYLDTTPRSFRRGQFVGQPWEDIQITLSGKLRE